MRSGDVLSELALMRADRNASVQRARKAEAEVERLRGDLSAIAQVLDQGAPDARRLATINRIVNHAMAQSNESEETR